MPCPPVDQQPSPRQHRKLGTGPVNKEFAGRARRPPHFSCGGQHETSPGAAGPAWWYAARRPAETDSCGLNDAGDVVGSSSNGERKNAPRTVSRRHEGSSWIRTFPLPVVVGTAQLRDVPPCSRSRREERTALGRVADVAALPTGPDELCPQVVDLRVAPIRRGAARGPTRRQTLPWRLAQLCSCHCPPCRSGRSALVPARRQAALAVGVGNFLAACRPSKGNPSRPNQIDERVAERRTSWNLPGFSTQVFLGLGPVAPEESSR